MSPGVWMVPIALASLALFLWAAARFESRLASRAYANELSTLATADSGVAPTATDTESPGLDSRPSRLGYPGIGDAPPPTKERGPSCTSE
jgi:hypothetical protein